MVKPRFHHLLICAISLLFFIAFNVSSEEQIKIVDRFTMGVFYESVSDIASRADVEVSLNFWARELIVKEAIAHNFQVLSSKAILYDRVEDMKNAFNNGELDLIIAPPLLISKYFNRDQLEDGFAGVHEGKKKDKVLLLVRQDKNINAIEDLPGKRLTMLANDELADVFLDTLVLKSFKKGYRKIGLSIQNQNRSNRIILDLFFDKFDAGVVYGSSYDVMTELNPDIANKVKILDEFPLKGRNISFFRKNYPLAKVFTDIAMGFNGTARAKQILEAFRTPEVDYCKVDELDGFDKLYGDYIQLKRQEKK
jgi:hypothetical protein